MPVVRLLLFTTVVTAFEDMSISLKDLLPPKYSSTPEPAWTGKYFPSPPPTKTTPSPLAPVGRPMGALNPDCDDGKTNLTVDWKPSPEYYTCYHPNQRFVPNFELQPILEVLPIPEYYSAYHYCMNQSITYLDPVPTFGPHRPAWPRYGEYTFVPVQRWLHTLEHGGVVMLHHPCAHPLEVERLRFIVKSCLFRHVISANRDLDHERPLVLLTWGRRLSMSTVNFELVRDFIKQHALQGPEKISRDGQYDQGLLQEANIVSDTEDFDLCPEAKLKIKSLFW